MTAHIKIDFISDVVCPWCVIGLLGLEAALQRLKGELEAEIRLQPFELNPAMPFEGQSLSEHVQEKYGASSEDARRTGETIRLRAAAVGFEMVRSPEARIYNTFAAHQLLGFAGEQGRQLELKLALFRAYFQRGENLSEVATLAAAARDAGLDPDAALGALEDRRFAAEVREKEALWRQEGITGVPTAILQGRYLIVGGQPPEAYERSLRSIAAEAVG
jgi:predicted DsbA family dithiol-disulfide isomerase